MLVRGNNRNRKMHVDKSDHVAPKRLILLVFIPCIECIVEGYTPYTRANEMRQRRIRLGSQPMPKTKLAATVQEQDLSPYIAEVASLALEVSGADDERPPWAKELASDAAREPFKPRRPRKRTLREQSQLTVEEQAAHSVRLSKLQVARRKAEQLAAIVRTEAFRYWAFRYVKEAEVPSEWTQSRKLYESYVRSVPAFASTRQTRRTAKLEIDTETQWGRMMGALYPNKRRRGSGWFYPVRLKRERLAPTAESPPRRYD